MVLRITHCRSFVGCSGSVRRLSHRNPACWFHLHWDHIYVDDFVFVSDYLIHLPKAFWNHQCQCATSHGCVRGARNFSWQHFRALGCLGTKRYLCAAGSKLQEAYGLHLSSSLQGHFGHIKHHCFCVFKQRFLLTDAHQRLWLLCIHHRTYKLHFNSFLLSMLHHNIWKLGQVQRDSHRIMLESLFHVQMLLP